MTSISSAVTPEAILAERGWVRALAFCLVRHDAEADDLSQAALLEALENPPVNLGAIRGWFRRVVKNRALNERRSTTRRSARERTVARPEALDATADVVARSETQREVVDAVHALPADLRDVVLLRFFEDLKTREIAERLGLPHGTVRSRLSRALGLLRVELDGRHGGDRAAWVVAILGAPPSQFTSPGIASQSGRTAAVLAGVLIVAGLGVTFAVARSDPSGASRGAASNDAVGASADGSRTTRGATAPGNGETASGLEADRELTPPATTTPASQAERTAWLKANAAAIVSLDADAALDDLAPLAETIGDARVVLLGEQTHGEGTTLAAKVRMVRYLHERMGFDVLVFESGMYGCRAANTAIHAEGVDPRAAAGLGIMPIWTRSRQMEPLWQYIAGHPIELAGFDCQVTGSARDRLIGDLRTVAATVGFSGDALERVVGAVERVRDYGEFPDWKNAREPLSQSFAAFRQKLVRPSAGGVRSGAEDRAFWVQLIESLEGQAANLATGSGRTAQCAENLLWLATTRYADRKMIVWSSTYHLQRNAPAIDTLDPDLVYTEVETVGHRLWKELGDASRVIGFVSAAGPGGLPWTAPWAPRAAPSEGSFEDLCSSAGLDNAIVDLQGVPAGHWLREPTIARPLANSEMRAAWPDVLDAFVFLKTRSPSMPAKDLPTGDWVPFDLLPAVEKELERIRDREERGYVYAPKWDLETVLERWLAAVRPDDTAILREELRLSAWWTGRDQSTSLAWRVHDVLAQMAAARGDLRAAYLRFDAAIAAHPQQELEQPNKHSGFQHLVNRAAHVHLRAEGPVNGIVWATRLLATDARFKVFWVKPWFEWLDVDDQRALVNSVASAYRERLRTFPAERVRIERELKELGKR